MTDTAATNKGIHQNSRFRPVGPGIARKRLLLSLVIVMLVLLSVSGIGFGIAETEGTREFFDSHRKAGEFLSVTYEPGINVMTNRDGSQYLSWYTRDRFLFVEMPRTVVTQSTNSTQTVLKFIELKNIRVIVVFEWLADHFNYLYADLAEKGIIREVRVYHDVWQRAIIYEIL